MSKWISLSRFAGALTAEDSPYRFGHDHDQLVRNVVLSRAVPTTGIAVGEFERQRIDHWLTLEAEIDVLLDRVVIVFGHAPSHTVAGPLFPVTFGPRARCRYFEDVTINEDEACEWLRENGGVSTQQPQRKRHKANSKRDEFETTYLNTALTDKEVAGRLKVSEKTIGRWRSKLSEDV
jgi:hypothetical protein